MKQSLRQLVGLGVAAGLAISGCTTTYTEEDLARQEVEEEDAARSEERRDRQIGEQGGANIRAIDEEIRQLD